MGVVLFLCNSASTVNLLGSTTECINRRPEHAFQRRKLEK